MAVILRLRVKVVGGALPKVQKEKSIQLRYSTYWLSYIAVIKYLVQKGCATTTSKKKYLAQKGCAKYLTQKGCVTTTSYMASEKVLNW